MAKAGKGVRTRQYNPVPNKQTGLHVEYSVANRAYFVMWHGSILNVVNTKAEAREIVKDLTRKNPGATNLAQYVMAAVEHARASHDAAGKIIHDTPKAKRREYAKEIWWRRGFRNPGRPFIGPDGKVMTSGARGTIPYRGLKIKRSGKLFKVFWPDGRQFTQKFPSEDAAYKAVDYCAKNPRGKNPGDAAAADSAYKTFHGAAPDRIKIRSVSLIDPFNAHPNLWQLGKLKSLTVGEFIEGFKGRYGDQPSSSDPDGWCVTIEVDENNAPDVAGEPGGRQLFIVGGDQNIDRYLSKLRVDPDKDPLDCGFVYRIEYFTRKDFDRFRPTNYWHHFGEETHVQPRLIYDRTNHRLQLAGGEYVVKREGIVN
jgi:hypothetical protein